MTDAEWLAKADPEQMLEFLAGGRKLRLFACECCRRVGHLFVDDRDREALAVVERFADGLVDLTELMAVRDRTTTEAIRQASWVPAHAAAVHASAVAAGMVAAEAGDRDHPKGLGD